MLAGRMAFFTRVRTRGRAGVSVRADPQGCVSQERDSRLKCTRNRKCNREEFGASQYGNRLVPFERLWGSA